MNTVTKQQLIEIRDKYLAGVKSLDIEITKLSNDRTATEGAAKALTALIEAPEQEETPAKAE